MMRPVPRWDMDGPKDWPRMNGAVKLIASVLSHVSRVRSFMCGLSFTPAAFTRISGMP